MLMLKFTLKWCPARLPCSYAAQSESLVAGAATTEVTHSLQLLSAEACHCLVVECALPLFTVALQVGGHAKPGGQRKGRGLARPPLPPSPSLLPLAHQTPHTPVRPPQASVPLQLLDAAASVAILSRCPPDPAVGSATLATYRCQDSTSRLAIKFRAREGQPGSLRAFPIPAVPPKTCRVVEHALRPLCLHERLTTAQGRALLQDGRPASQMSITGEAWWAGWCTLSDLPAVPQLPAVHCRQEACVFPLPPTPHLPAPFGHAPSLPSPAHWDSRCGASLTSAPVTPAHAGTFSPADAHGWINAALPDLPRLAPTQAPPAGGGSDAGGASVCWRHCERGTLLLASYKAGQAEFWR
jgi:hypothetical protein